MNIKEYISSGIIELYVMGLCSPEEEKEFEQLRAKYPELNQAVIQFELQLEKNMLQNSTLPSTGTDERILQKLESLKQAPVVQLHTGTDRIRKIGWLKPAAAAAAILFAVSAFLNYSLYKKNKKLNGLVTASATSPLPLADYAVITNPAITPVAMYGQGSHAICRCTLFWDKKTGKAYLMIHHLIKGDQAKEFQLWAEVNGKPVNIGLIDGSVRGKLVEVSGVPSGAVAFSVTLEKSGGSTAPTMEEIYLKGHI